MVCPFRWYNMLLRAANIEQLPATRFTPPLAAHGHTLRWLPARILTITMNTTDACLDTATQLQRAMLQQSHAVDRAAITNLPPTAARIPSSVDAASLALAALDDAAFEAAARRHAQPALGPPARVAPPTQAHPATPLQQVPTLMPCSAGSKRAREFDELISAPPARQPEEPTRASLGPMPDFGALLQQQRGTAPALQASEFHRARNALACAQLSMCAMKSDAASTLTRLLTAVQDAARS